MRAFLDYAMSGFWPFVGCWILASIPFTCLFKCWNRFMRHLNIKHEGWPPPHLDADGDAIVSGEKDTP